MSASTEPTTNHQICPGCAQTESTHWVTSTPDTDTWACRHCGTEWTITIHTTGVPR